MHDVSITFYSDVPARRRVGQEGYPWGTISNSGEAVKHNGWLYFFDVARIFDPREPKGQRVTYDVELRRRWGKTTRVVNGGREELRQAIIDAFKEQIERDNRKQQDDQWAASFPKEPAPQHELKDAAGGTWIAQETGIAKTRPERAYWVQRALGNASSVESGILGFYAYTLAGAYLRLNPEGPDGGGEDTKYLDGCAATDEGSPQDGDTCGTHEGTPGCHCERCDPQGASATDEDAEAVAAMLPVAQAILAGPDVPEVAQVAEDELDGLVVRIVGLMSEEAAEAPLELERVNLLANIRGLTPRQVLEALQAGEPVSGYCTLTELVRYEPSPELELIRTDVVQGRSKPTRVRLTPLMAHAIAKHSMGRLCPRVVRETLEAGRTVHTFQYSYELAPAVRSVAA